MRTKILIITILPLLIFGCTSSIWIAITKKESKLYTKNEKLILIDAASAVNYGYGFDPDLLIDYLFIAGKFTDKEITARSPEMKKAMAKYNADEIVSFYEKTVRLKETLIWKIDNLTKNKKWINATYIQRELLPEAELFLSILEKNVIQINPQYGLNIEAKKSAIKKRTIYRLDMEYEDMLYRKQRRER
ncbi:MAG: hypothetical protein FWG49_00300 [Leptospirales bacterium]|nr:hypothetical protein [Leptospirales bacterium]